MPDTASNPASAPRSRRWTIFAAALLLIALALVVIYTSRAAFMSPIALVVVAAIGLAALLLQLRLRDDLSTSVRAPMWLNILGLLFALVAVFADRIRLGVTLMHVAALAAILCFGIGGIIVLQALRKRKM